MATEIELKRKRRRWAASVAVVVILPCVLWWAFSAAMQARVAARDSLNRQNFKSIGLALHNYHDNYHSFPPAYVLGKDGRRWHSWRVLLLPYLGDEAKQLYRQYQFDEPWDGPNNKRLAEQIPQVYASPFENIGPNCTPYVAVVGSRTVWPGPFTVHIADIIDGTSNTLMLIENPGSLFNWLAPEDFTYASVQKFYRNRMRMNGSGEDKAFLILLCDQHVMSHAPTASFGGRFLGLLTRNGGGSRFNEEQLAKYFPDESKAAQGRVVAHQFGPVKSADAFKATDITPHLSAKITPQKNIVYCATFQLAWDECRTTQCDDKPIQLSGQPRMAHELNKHPFPRQSLSAECYFAAGGQNSEITAAMSARFPHVTPKLTPPAAEPYVTFYAYLEKNMPFAEDFEALAKPISFQTHAGKKKVKSFGLEPTVTNAKTGEPVATEQVRLLYYTSMDDFVIRLTTDGQQQDEIILAKIPPAATLAATRKQARSRIRKKTVPYNRFLLETVDTLAVPVMELNVEKSFKQLIGRKIQNKGPVGGWFVAVARQFIRLRIDETGGALISAAEFQVVGSLDDEKPKPPPPPRAPRRIVFDKPFLMLLQEPGAKEPYFVAWMANTELMEPSE